MRNLAREMTFDLSSNRMPIIGLCVEFVPLFRLQYQMMLRQKMVMLDGTH